jgi:hypothetical protein
MDKLEEVKKWSNPTEVQKRGKELGLAVFLSNRKDKKYAIYHPDTDKIISFGQMGYEDYTKTGDEDKKKAFQKRNHKWLYADKYSPAWLSWNLLW